MRGVRARRRRAVGADRDRRRHEGVPPEPDPIVGRGDGACDRVELGTGAAELHRSAGELRGDGGPRGVGVPAGEFPASQARTRPGFDEWADLGAVVVEDDREMRDVGAEPRKLRRRRDHPARHEHREGDPVGVGAGRRDGAVTECLEPLGDAVGDRRVTVECDERALSALRGCPRSIALRGTARRTALPGATRRFVGRSGLGVRAAVAKLRGGLTPVGMIKTCMWNASLGPVS